MTPPRPRVPGGNCSTAPVIAGARGAICGQIMALDVHSSRPERRSDDGQTILKAALAGWKLRSHLGKLVELRGFEPRTSCMPSAGSTSARVHPRRSPSRNVRTSPPESGPVAVLSCCTALSPRRCVLRPTRDQSKSLRFTALATRNHARHRHRKSSCNGRGANGRRPLRCAHRPVDSARTPARRTPAGACRRPLNARRGPR